MQLHFHVNPVLFLWCVPGGKTTFRSHSSYFSHPSESSSPFHHGTETGCFLYHFSNVWIETYLSECQNVLRLCAFPLSIVNLLVNQYIGEFCLYNGSQYQQWEMRDYKNLERSVQANIIRNITSLGKLSC